MGMVQGTVLLTCTRPTPDQGVQAMLPKSRRNDRSMAEITPYLILTGNASLRPPLMPLEMAGGENPGCAISVPKSRSGKWGCARVPPGTMWMLHQ